jgi:NitT/TauT family transport system permease protein
MKDVLIPASLPGYLSGLRQGWAFSWRSLMAAELIATSSKLGLGLGQLMNQGRDLGDAPTMYTALILIFIVGVGIEVIFFRPVERRILSARGLTPGAR